MKLPIALTVNGDRCEIFVDGHHTLLDVLRDQLELRGVKEGCESGNCGACTVVMNGDAVVSCMVLAPDADGAEIVTVEGLAESGELHPLQRRFIELGAIQCGYCTPGMLMSAYALLQKNPDPTEEEIRRTLAGNLCRCTGYTKIVDAIREASGE
jgi:carbon-monoxide dehydrogenase small subunit